MTVMAKTFGWRLAWALGALAAVAALGFILAENAANPKPHARADEDRCAAKPAALANLEPSRPPQPVPEVPFVEGDALPRTLADFRGEGLVVNFWATWCAPCVREMPALDRLHAELAGRGARVLAISADRAGAAAVRQFYDVNRIAHLAVLVDREMALARRLGLKGLPTTLLVDRDGNEVARVVGVAEWDAPAAVAFLSRCLAG